MENMVWNRKGQKSKDQNYEKPVFSDLRKNYQLYLMVILPTLYIILFKYVPMYGSQIAFKDFTPMKGIFGSEWVGFKHFIRFFNSPQFKTVVSNTLRISIYSHLLSIPLPVIFALAVNYCNNKYLKKSSQMISYLPHFLSVVIIVSFMTMLFNYNSGAISNICESLFGFRPNVLGQAKYFDDLYVWSGIWQNIGWSSILYVSALAGVDVSLHEAAMIDGASKWQRVWHIDIPCILPTIAIMLIMSMGSILSVGFDKTFIMQNATNLSASEVLSTFEYKRGMGAALPDYSYPAAIGLLTSGITFILVMITNKLSNKMSGYGMW